MNLASLLACASLALPARPANDVVRIPDCGLSLDLPALEKPSGGVESGAQRRGRWRGTLGPCQVEITLSVLPAGRFGIDEPEDVTALVGKNLGERSAFAFSSAEFLAGSFGFVPYAHLCAGDLRSEDSTAAVGRLWVLGGKLPEAGWALQVECRPVPAAAAEKALRAFLERGVSYEGERRDPGWSDEESLERWKEFASEDAVEKFEGALRTEHYVILSNSSGKQKFAEKMEECYDTIRGIFPFPEVPGRKLMPVFLFRSSDQYFEYFSKIAGITLEQARKSKGHAWRDYYATWYEAPNDPVHVHEATHQIFANRLGLHGGGSWLQEGVAEYVETRKNDRNAIANVVKKGRHTPLREFLAIPSLLMSAADDVKGGNEAGDHYKQAALLIEFLRESRWGKGRFDEFLHAVGVVRPNDVDRIEDTVRRIYGTDLEGLEDQWVQYCKKR